MSTHFWFGGEDNPYLVENSVKLNDAELNRTPSEEDPYETGKSSEIATNTVVGSTQTLQFTAPTSLDTDLKTELFAVGDTVTQDEAYTATTDNITTIVGDDSYQIDQSLRFNSDDTANLSRTPGVTGNLTTWTWSGWVKKTLVTTSTDYRGIFTARSASNNYAYIDFSDNKIRFANRPSSGVITTLETTAVFTDPSAWFHLVLIYDSTNADFTERVRLYANGVRQTFSTEDYPSASQSGIINSNIGHYIGYDLQNTGYLDGYLAEVNFVDGQALEPTAFGEFDADGVWRPIEASITGINDGSTYISSSTLNSGLRGGGAGDSAMFDGVIPSSYSEGGNFGGTQVNSSTTSSSLTINLSKSLSGRVTIYPYFAASASSCSITFSNGNTVNMTGSVLDFSAYDLGTQPSFNSFTLNQTYLTGGGSNFGIGGIAIDGQLLIDGVGPYGTNGFYLPFEASDLGADESGNGNDWTTNGLSSLPSQDYAVYSGTQPVNPEHPFTSSVVSPNVDSTGAITNAAWSGAYIGSNATVIWIPTTPVPVGATLDVYGGAYDNLVRSYTITVTYTDATTDVFNGQSGSSNWVGRFSATPAGKSIQQISVQCSSYPQLNAVRVDGVFLFSNDTSDSVVDSPTNGSQADTGAGGEVAGNYATLDPNHTYGSPTISNGNLDVSGLSSGIGAAATIGVTSGKWYWEGTDMATGTMFGIADMTFASLNYNLEVVRYYFASTGNLWGTLGNSTSNVSYGETYTRADVIGVALDMDTGFVNFYKNGVDQGVANTDSLVGKTITAAINSSGTGTASFNFGQRPFAYPAPEGFKALRTSNL